MALKPNNITFEQAAAVPTSGYIALSNLGGVGTLKTGRKVLINGAGGCMGTLAIQIAKSDGARVTAVDCAEKLRMIRSGYFYSAPRIGKAHAHHRQNVFAQRSSRSHAVYARRACGWQNHHHAMGVVA